MKLFLILRFLLFLVPFIVSCRSDRSKVHHHLTFEVCDKSLFVETFTIFGSGAFGGDRVSQYLTDSTNFRIYIGTFDNAHEGYSYQCFGDSIKISKIGYDTIGKGKTESINLYNISDLRKSNKFE